MGLHVDTQPACMKEDFATVWTMELTFDSNFGHLLHIIFSLPLKDMQVHLTMREAWKDIHSELQTYYALDMKVDE